MNRSLSEQFYVLFGQIRLSDGRTWVTAGPGDFLYIPEGGLDAFRGGGGASMLLMLAPGCPSEDYFEALSRGEEMTGGQRAAIMFRHDTYWIRGGRPGSTPSPTGGHPGPQFHKPDDNR